MRRELDVQTQHTFVLARLASLALLSLDPPCMPVVEGQNLPAPSSPRKRGTRIKRVVVLIETGLAFNKAVNRFRQNSGMAFDSGKRP
jgi:hypothetical protein